MALTREVILQRVSGHVNGTDDVPTGDELDLWTTYLNTADEEWPSTFDPQVLRKVHRTTMGLSGTSVALPGDFKEKFAGFILIDGNPVQELDPVESTILSGDYVTWGGSQMDGYYLNTSTARTTLSSLVIPYHSRPTSMASGSVSPCPRPNFLIFRTTEYAMLKRGRAEYVEFQQKADTELARMIEAESATDIQKNKTIRSSSEYAGFVIGED